MNMKYFKLIFISILLMSTSLVKSQNYEFDVIEITQNVNSVNSIDDYTCTSIKIINDSLIYLDDKLRFTVSNFWEENGKVDYTLFIDGDENKAIGGILIEDALFLYDDSNIIAIFNIRKRLQTLVE